MAFSPPEYCRLFAQKKAYQGGVTGTPGPPLATPLRPEGLMRPHDFKGCLPNFDSHFLQNLHFFISFPPVSVLYLIAFSKPVLPVELLDDKNTMQLRS